MAERLRIGILCDGLVFKHWQAECIRRVLAVEGVEPVLVVVQDRSGQARPDPLWRHALYRWFKRTRLRAGALQPEDLSAELAGIARITCRPEGARMAQRLSKQDLEIIRGYAPDVLLRFGFGVLLGEILTVAPHGIWSYHLGDTDGYRGRPEGFWEIVRGEPVTGVTLQRLTEDVDGGNILRKGWYPTIRRSLSANIDGALLASTDWMAGLCRQLLQGRKEVSTGSPPAMAVPLSQPPGNVQLLDFLITCNAERMAHERRLRSQREEWNIGVLYQPIASLLEPKPSFNTRWLPAPGPGQHRKAPFGYMADGQLNVLYGKFDAAKGKGEISRLRPKRDNVLKRSRTMLTHANALAHPFLIEHEGRSLVIPEGGEGRVDLYRVNEANELLEFVCTLVHEPLCAPTVFRYEGRWWLLGTKAPLEDVALHAYHAPTLEGPWEPHALAPLKVDVRSAKPGGTPFMHEGRLYRPAVDNSPKHAGIAIMRVLELTPTTFAEEWVKTIAPFKGSPWSHGIGTLSAAGGMTLVDGMRPVPMRSDDRSLQKGRSERTGGRSSERDADDDDDDED